MSLETAKTFIEHINSNQAYESILSAFDVDSGQWDLDKLVELGKAAGFEFSGEDMKAAIAEMPANELSDEDLDQVAGGLVCACTGACRPN